MSGYMVTMELLLDERVPRVDAEEVGRHWFEQVFAAEEVIAGDFSVKEDDSEARPCHDQLGYRERFLLVRLGRSNHGWVGLSSNAMVIAAMAGGDPTERPMDGADLGRCLVTRAMAPPDLHERMDEIIAGWTEHVAQRCPDSYGAPFARTFFDMHIDRACEAMAE